MAIERTSSTWIEIEAWAKKSIETARDNLEEADDECERGRLAAFRELLALSPSSETQTETVDYHS